MACNEQLRRQAVEQRAHRRVVVAGVAANVLDEHVDVFALEAVQFAVHEPQVAPVAVAAHGAQGSERRQFLGHLNRTDVACVPNLVAGFKVVQVLLVPVAVGVADDAYLFQNLEKLK